MVDLAELQDRIRTHMYLQSIQPDDWFEDFDKLRSGRVTVDRFRRCFEFIRFRLTDAEFNALVQEYGDRGQVCYRRFLDTHTPDLWLPGAPTHPMTYIDGLLTLLGRKKRN